VDQGLQSFFQRRLLCQQRSKGHLAALEDQTDLIVEMSKSWDITLSFREYEEENNANM
jgi:hypothetical protein